MIIYPLIPYKHNLMSSDVLTNKCNAIKYLVSKYDQLTGVPGSTVVCEIGKTTFTISKDNAGISLNYTSQAHMDFTYICTTKQEFESFVATIFI